MTVSRVILLILSLLLAFSACKKATTDTTQEIVEVGNNVNWQKFNSKFPRQRLPWSLKIDSTLLFEPPMDTALSSLYLGMDSGVVYHPVARFEWNSNVGFIYGKTYGEIKSIALLTCDSSGTVLDQLDFFQDYLLDNPDSRSSVSILLDEKGNLRIDQFLRTASNSSEEPLQSFVYHIGSEGNIEDLNHVDHTLSEREEEVVPLIKP